MAVTSVLKRFQTGFRTIQGEALNKIVDTINGLTGTAMRMPVRAGLTASTTQTQAGGLALTAGAIHSITSSNSSDALTLPAGAVNTYLVVGNNTGNSIQVFPNVGAAINGGSTDASLALGANKTGIYYCVAPLVWVANVT